MINTLAVATQYLLWGGAGIAVLELWLYRKNANLVDESLVKNGQLPLLAILRRVRDQHNQLTKLMRNNGPSLNRG